MKRLAATAVTLLLAACSSNAVYPTVTVQDLKTALDGGGYVLDVRTPPEYAEGHVPTAINLPLDQVEARAAEVPGDKPVYVICHSGNRSKTASEILKKAGKDVKNVGGGILAWTAAGYPVVK